MRWFRLLGACCVLTAVIATSARAHRRNFTYTYDWFTPAKNEKELELWWTQEQGGEADVWLEFEYGVTDRWVVAPYLLTKREHGGKWEVEGWKLEQRYRFGDLKERRLLPAAYLEIEREHDEYELELKAITSYLWSGNIWSFNLIAEKALQGGEEVEWGYATGLARRPRRSGLWLGGELFGNFTEEEHFGGPVVGYSIRPNTHLILTGGLGLNHNSAGRLRLLFEHEWF
jgi:hypothetical protein